MEGLQTSPGSRRIFDIGISSMFSVAIDPGSLSNPTQPIWMNSDWAIAYRFDLDGS